MKIDFTPLLMWISVPLGSYLVWGKEAAGAAMLLYSGLYFLTKLGSLL